jgi:anhydro-N-acetylmuramic acid kinase
MGLLQELAQKESKTVIGLMSGTSVDGIDCVLVRIDGHGEATTVTQLDYLTAPIPAEVRRRILALMTGTEGGAREICLLHSLLGQLYAQACLDICDQAGIDPADVDLVGSHGQTIYHIPQAEKYAGHMVRGSLQLGDPSPIAQVLGCAVVSDFRGRDMAVGGQGAPLVSYAEYLLYKDPARTVALQNLGGIGNITLLPAGGTLADTIAFDTGPGNVLMDALMEIFTDGETLMDEDGEMAAKGHISEDLAAFLMQDSFLTLPPPKTTGRERYSRVYVDEVLRLGLQRYVSPEDIIATVNMHTARTVALAVERFCPVKPQRLIVGGGGSRNPVLMENITRVLPACEVIDNEELGFDGDAKEAIAFAILANETIHEHPNNVPSVTGATSPVVMGRISL